LVPASDVFQPPAYESTLSVLVKPFFLHLIPLLFTGSRRRITLPDLRDIPLYLRSDPATEKLLAALAVEDKNSNQYLVKVRLTSLVSRGVSPSYRAHSGRFVGTSSVPSFHAWWSSLELSVGFSEFVRRTSMLTCLLLKPKSPSSSK
jgi:hypothetical protein